MRRVCSKLTLYISDRIHQGSSWIHCRFRAWAYTVMWNRPWFSGTHWNRETFFLPKVLPQSKSLANGIGDKFCSLAFPAKKITIGYQNMRLLLVIRYGLWQDVSTQSKQDAEQFTRIFWSNKSSEGKHGCRDVKIIWSFPSEKLSTGVCHEVDFGQARLASNACLLGRLFLAHQQNLLDTGRIWKIVEIWILEWIKQVKSENTHLRAHTRTQNSGTPSTVF